MQSYKPRPNYLWSIISVAGVLLLVAIFTFVTLHSKDLVRSFKEEFEIVMELSPTLKDDQVPGLIKKLEQEPDVLAGSIQFVSKEDGLKALAEDLGEDLLISEMPNPLFDVILFNLKAETFSDEHLVALTERLKSEYQGVLDVYYEASLVQQVTSNLDRLSIFFLLAGGVLIFFALTFIHNSIRLSIYANRFLIRNMELVGASWGFIRKPFLTRSLRHGLISAILALLILAGLGAMLWNQIPEIASFLKMEFLVMIAALTFLIGLVINLASTYYVVTRFLKMRLSELHN